MGIDDNKRFYWLKLRKDFFQQHQIKVLKSLPNGRLYALIYLELLAESTSHNGELRYSEMLPYDINTLAKVIDEDNDNLKCAVDTLMKLELVEILEDKTIYLREINKLIGSETGQTIRKNLAKVEGGKNYQKNTKENRVKSIENRVKSKNNRFIKPTIDELKEYIQEKNYSIDPEYFYNYYESKGWYVGKVKMKSWKATLNMWNARNKKNNPSFAEVDYDVETPLMKEYKEKGTK